MRAALQRIGLRRLAISAGVVGLTASALFATDTLSSFTPEAQAGRCFTEAANWKMKSGTGGPDVGRVQFGATICLGDDGNIDSVTPILSGGIEGAGTPMGFIWDNRGAWVQRSTDTSVEVRGQAKMRLCIAGKYTPICSLTDTQDFTLRWTNQYGPYVPGTEPGIFARSTTTHLAGGTSQGTTFIRQ